MKVNDIVTSKQYVLYLNGRPITTYDNLKDARGDVYELQKKSPGVNFEIRQEICRDEPLSKEIGGIREARSPDEFVSQLRATSPDIKQVYQKYLKSPHYRPFRTSEDSTSEYHDWTDNFAQFLRKEFGRMPQDLAFEIGNHLYDYIKMRDREDPEGVAESGPFNYGAKKPRAGSVADLAAKKRREQERGQRPIEPQDQMVGVAKVTKGVAEGIFDTLKQKLLPNRTPMPKHGDIIRVNGREVKISYVPGGYIGFAWRDKNGEEQYEELYRGDYRDGAKLEQDIADEIKQADNPGPMDPDVQAIINRKRAEDPVLDQIMRDREEQEQPDFSTMRTSSTIHEQGVAEGSDIEYVVVIRDDQGKRSIRISALTPTDAKEKAEAQGYKVLKVKDPQDKHYFKEQGVAEGSETQKTFEIVYYSPKTDRNITKTVKADSESAVWDRLKEKGIDVISVEEQGVTEGHQSCPECGGPSYSNLILAEKKDACYHKVKSRVKVWPSAYASGQLVQCRKRGASNWGTGGKKK